ncbi:MAG: 3-carboxy-cis,cis-muconate cycloisomerase, partial [Hyphomicrobiales bacterium]|nr:3-carboxy-cis,cis-muconate cycloisomerase [Hyphomicrobiales bacterium]
MAALALDTSLYGGLLGDAEFAALLSDAAEIAAMIRAEKALARAQARLGIIPGAAGEALAAALETVVIDPAALRAGLARDGVAVPQLVAALRGQLPPELRPWLHWGATSQDISDLALVLRLSLVLDAVEARLDALIRRLAGLADTHRATLCLARTRTQAAAPTLFGLRVANWLQPLLRHRARLGEIRPRLLVVQLGGAAGTLAAFGPQAIALMDALADELGLGRAVPWHKARDRIEEFGGLLAMITASLGMIGADLMQLAQSEVAEITFDGAGGSSTLPQKQNPVVAEVLVALARFAAHQVGALHQAAIHPTERDGAAWTLEWLALPPLIQATGAALRQAGEAFGDLRVDTARMRANLDATRGLVLAEAA